MKPYRRFVLLAAALVLVVAGACAVAVGSGDTDPRQAKRQELQSAGAVLIGKFPTGSCGSQYHPSLRFEANDPNGIEVYYLPKDNAYYVMGKARVTNDVQHVTTDVQEPVRRARSSSLAHGGPDTSHFIWEKVTDANGNLLGDGVLLARFDQGSCGTPFHDGIRFGVVDGPIQGGTCPAPITTT